MESIGEATLLYVMASDLLGERPHELGDCEQGDAEQMRYAQIAARIRSDNCGALIRSLESQYKKK